MPATYNIEVPKGEDWSITLTWYTSTTKTTTQDLTGWSAEMQVRERHSSTAIVTTLSSTGEITLGSTAGTIVLSIASSVSNAIDTGRKVYDLEMTDTGGDITRLLEGDIDFTPNVTR